MQSILTIGITGGSGAGKTALADALAARLSGAVPTVRTDWYYRDLSHLSLAQRESQNFDDPEAIEWPLFVSQVEDLRQGRPIQRPVYDFESHTRRRGLEVIGPADALIVEGVFALARPELRALLDVAVYVEANESTRFKRRLTRDMKLRGRTAESVERQFRRTVAPMHLRHIEPQRELADVIVDGEASLDLSVDQVLKALAAG